MRILQHTILSALVNKKTGEMCVLVAELIRDKLGDRYYGRCVVMLGDPPTLPYRQVRSWGWGAKQYCACFTRSPTEKQVS